jgi:hypothetical protein
VDFTIKLLPPLEIPETARGLDSPQSRRLVTELFRQGLEDQLKRQEEPQS